MGREPRKEGMHLEDLSMDHGGFDGNTCGTKAVKLGDQFGASLQDKLATWEPSAKRVTVCWTRCNAPGWCPAKNIHKRTKPTSIKTVQLRTSGRQ